MTKKELISTYIPSPRDKSLGEFEYYVEDLAGRIQRVEITDIIPQTYDSDINLVVQSKTRKQVKGWQDCAGFTTGYLYDNKQDCKNRTHNCYPCWEQLRKIQQEV